MGRSKINIQKREEYRNNPNKCQICGKPILLIEDEPLSKTTRKRYCSRECAGLAGCFKNEEKNKSIILQLSNEQIIEYYNSSDNWMEFIKKCGYKNRVGFGTVFQEKFKELGLDREKLRYEQKSMNERTKGELIKEYGSTQTGARIRNHSRNTYLKSDRPKKCIVCGYDKHIEVAHINPINSFDDDSLISEINNIDNLIALCPNHHWEYDNGELNINDIL